MKKPFLVEDLIKLLPQINDIQDEGIREKTIRAWELAYNDGNFDNLESARFNKFCDYVTLCQHTRSVTEMSIQLAKMLQNNYHYEIDFDNLISIAVLHDISKLLENTPTENGQIAQTEVGKRYQHAFFSTYYAAEVGLPHTICSSILTHTHHTHTLPTTLEGIIITYADLADADSHRFALGKPLHVASLH